MVRSQEENFQKQKKNKPDNKKNAAETNSFKKQSELNGNCFVCGDPGHLIWTVNVMIGNGDNNKYGYWQYWMTNA